MEELDEDFDSDREDGFDSDGPPDSEDSSDSEREETENDEEACLSCTVTISKVCALR